MRKRKLFKLIAAPIALFGLVTLADTNPDADWHSGYDNSWGQVLNWEHTGGGAPTQGYARLNANNVCDPQGTYSCTAEWPNPKVCSGGPYNGESCDTDEDCDCDGGYYTAIWDWSGGSRYSFDQIEVEGWSDSSMEWQKGNSATGVGTKQIYVTDLEVRGYSSTRKAILDVQENNDGSDIDIQADDLLTSSYVDIILADDTDLKVDTDFVVECAGADTVTDLDGGGTLDASAGRTYIHVNGSCSATLTVDVESDGDFDVGDLEMVGGCSSTAYKATFDWDAGMVDTFDSATLKGLTEIDVDAMSGLEGNIDVNGTVLVGSLATSACDTVATIAMPSSSYRFGGNNITIQAGTNDVELSMSSGDLTCSGTVTLDGDTANGTDAKLSIPLSGVTTSLTHMTINSRGIPNLSDDVSISGTLTFAEDYVENHVVTIAQNHFLVADKIVVQADVQYRTDLPSGAMIKTTN